VKPAPYELVPSPCSYTMQFAVNELKTQYIHRKPSDAKFIHVVSSGYKALMSWHMSRTLQACQLPFSL
jgi:acyl-CoA oxidase